MMTQQSYVSYSADTRLMGSSAGLADAAYDTEQGIFYFIRKKILITPLFCTLRIHNTLINNENYISPKQYIFAFYSHPFRSFHATNGIYGTETRCTLYILADVMICVNEYILPSTGSSS
jgi:hypothetical protein